MIDVGPRAKSHPLGRFVNESVRSAGMLALVLLIVEVLMQVPFAAPPSRLLVIVLAVGVANTALLWTVKARLRAR